MKKTIRHITITAVVVCMAAMCACSWLRLQVPDPEMQGISSDLRSLEAEEDNLQKAYGYFTLSSMHQRHGRIEVAREYLSKAVENDPDSAYLNRKMALILKSLKDYQNALIYARKCSDLEPENIGHRVLVAELYSLADEDASALEEYKKILEIDPDQRRIRLIMTTVLIKNGDFTDAKVHLDRLIQEDPGAVIPHYYRGRINLEMKDFAQAEKAFLEALRLDPRMEPALFDLGSLYQMTERYGDAAEIYERLLRADPSNGIVRERLINVYFEAGQEAKAEKYLEEIRKRAGPGDPQRQTLGLIYLRHGRLDASIEELDLIVSAWPDDSKSRYYLAAAYEEKGDTEKALDHFGRVGEGSEYYSKAIMHMAYILDGRERTDEAVEILKRAVAVEREQVELHLMLATFLETGKAYEEAVTVLREGLERDQRNVDLLFRYGVVLDKMGRKDACILEMKKILEIDPEHADALNYIGYTYAEQGIRLDEAEALIERALRVKPDSGYIVDSLGWVFYQKGRYDEAVKQLERAASLVPEDPTVAEHLGDVYSKKGRYEEGLEMYEKALSLTHPEPEKIRAKIEEIKKLLGKDRVRQP
ncbi:MAG: tetratricopeptide repeat protein [Desulfatiglandales bacterium]